MIELFRRENPFFPVFTFDRVFDYFFLIYKLTSSDSDSDGDMQSEYAKLVKTAAAVRSHFL